MADTKVSGLPAVTTVADGDEYLVTRSGATNKITGANVKAAVAPVGATYITQTASSGLSAEQALGALGTGILKSTTTTGVVSIAAGTDLPTGIPIASLADPTTGKVIGSSASAAAAVFPPAYEFSYNQITTTVTSTQTVQASADTVIGPTTSVTYDGSTIVVVQVYVGAVQMSAATSVYLHLWRDSTDLVKVAQVFAGGSTGVIMVPTFGSYRETPTAGAHTYTLKMFSGAANTATAHATAPFAPAFIRVIKV